MKKKKHKKSNRFRNVNEFDEHLDKANDVFDKILELTSEFCRQHLTKEYYDLCEDLTWAAYEEGLPLEKGRPAGWACGIVHAIGYVNFLHDPNHLPYMTSAQLANGFGVSQQTMLTKSKTIRDEFDMIQFDPHWCLPSLLDDNPMVWTLDVNGFMIDARYAPLEFQREAYRIGLIPYIPGDKSQQESEPQSGSGAKIIEFPSGRNKTPVSQPARNIKDEGHNLFEGLEG